MSDNAKASPPKGVIKNLKGKIVGSGQRLMAYNIYVKHRNTNEGLSKTAAVKLAAEDVGLSVKLMFKIVGEMESTGKLTSPKTTKNRLDTYSKLSEDQKKAIEGIVNSFFKKNEIPTLDKVLQATKENELISPVSRSTLFRVLKKLGFVREKRSRKGMLVKRDNVILWRKLANKE